jgi:hypothetical protein
MISKPNDQERTPSLTFQAADNMTSSPMRKKHMILKISSLHQNAQKHCTSQLAWLVARIGSVNAPMQQRADSVAQLSLQCLLRRQASRCSPQFHLIVGNGFFGGGTFA